MKKKGFIIGALALIGVTIACILVLTTNKKEQVAPEFVFLYAENQPEDYPTTRGAQYFAKLVEEKTEGRIRILVKYGGELGVEKDIIDQLRYGGVDFARISLSQLAEKIPDMNVLQLPYIYRDSSHMWSVLDGEIGDYFMNLTKDYNLVSLSWYEAGARSFYTASKPITCLADVQGLKIRVQDSQLMADMITAMGGIPVKIEYEDVYSALQRGLVDGAENNWSSYIFMNHVDVAQYFCVDEHTRVPELQLCSQNTWNMLSDKDKEIISDSAKKSAIYERILWKQQESSSMAEAVNRNATIIRMSVEKKQEFQDAMTGVFEQYGGDNADMIQKIINMGVE